MTEPKKIGCTRVDNQWKSSLDKPQWKSIKEVIQNFQTKFDVINAELRKENLTIETLADVLPNQLDLRLEEMVETRCGEQCAVETQVSIGTEE